MSTKGEKEKRTEVKYTEGKTAKPVSRPWACNPMLNNCLITVTQKGMWLSMIGNGKSKTRSIG